MTESRPVVAWDLGVQEEKEDWLTKRQEEVSEGVGRVIPECGDGFHGCVCSSDLLGCTL